jgi:magnesium-transporting ATPase (P-type)
MANRPYPLTVQTPDDWHLREVHALAQAHEVDPKQGLQAQQVDQRTQQYGANALPTADGRSLGALVLEQFSDFMILMLLGAMLLTFLLQMATIYVPFLNPIFKTHPLSRPDLALCLAAAGVVWMVVELEKAWRRSRRSKTAVPG